MLRKLVLGVAALALTAGTAAAQAGGGQFRVDPRVGYTMYKDATGLRPGVNFGINAVFFATNNIGVGVLLDYARPQTDSSYFPAELSFGDTTFVYAVQQPVTITQFHLMGEFRFGNRLQPFLSASAGGYRINLDAQAAAGVVDFTQWGASVGGGVSFQASEFAGVRLEVRDFMFFSYDRDNLNVTRNRFTPARYPNVLPQQAPFSGSAHNIQFALAFTFTPGGR